MLSIILGSAWHNIKRHPLRTFLTILQISIGIACVVSVLSYRMNLQAMLGHPVGASEDLVVAIGGEFRNEQGGLTRVTYPIFTEKDVAELASDSSMVEAVSPVAQFPVFVAEANGMRYLVRGGASVGADYAKIYDLEIIEGSFITRSDVENKSDVVVISESLGKILFGSPPYVGKTIEVLPRVMGGMEQSKSEPVPRTKYRVIGVFRGKSGQANPLSPTGKIAWSAFWPATVDPTGVARAPGLDMVVRYPYTTLSIRAKPGKAGMVRDRIKTLISGRRRPGIPVADTDGRARVDDKASVTFESPGDRAKMILRSTSQLTLALGGAVFVALVVSAIGILSIMMVSVVERTREIGLRRALGASRGAIILQFTLDSTILAFAGGALGILLAFWLYPLIKSVVFERTWFATGSLVSPYPAPLAALGGIALAAASGALFGFIPAFQAAKVEPAEILREL